MGDYSRMVNYSTGIGTLSFSQSSPHYVGDTFDISFTYIEPSVPPNGTFAAAVIVLYPGDYWDFHSNYGAFTNYWQTYSSDTSRVITIPSGSDPVPYTVTDTWLETRGYIYVLGIFYDSNTGYGFNIYTPQGYPSFIAYSPPEPEVVIDPQAKGYWYAPRRYDLVLPSLSPLDELRKLTKSYHLNYTIKRLMLMTLKDVSGYWVEGTKLHTVPEDDIVDTTWVPNTGVIVRDNKLLLN